MLNHIVYYPQLA